MSTDTFLYFAYGSNMLSARLRAPERCPSARAVGLAQLPGYELRWHKHSKKDQSGKCDIIASDVSDAVIFGVLYEIANDERAALDREEGLNKGYNAIEPTVIFGDSPLMVRSYQASIIDPELRPYTWYRALVIAGAKEHGLPASYIAGLESVAADEDHDRDRHDKNIGLIAGTSA
jgi:hypothetical protein